MINLVSITNDQINNFLMNLKYNRLDMKNQQTEGNMTMRLRKRPSISQNQNITKITKRREKIQKKQRHFGTDLTNQPINSDNTLMDIEPPAISTPQPRNQIEPYLSSILQHINELDQCFQRKISTQLHLQAQKGELKVTADMRKVLLRWLLQVGRKFQVKQQTIHICVQLIDYVLIFSTNLINTSNFQLLGIAALFVASKYNEIHTYQAEKYVYVCDGLYSLQQLFQMEGTILTSTKFNLQFPTIHQFTDLAMVGESDQITGNVAMLSNLAIFDFTLFNQFKKQHLAAVIIYFAMKMKDPTTIKSRDVIKNKNVPEEVFAQCSKIIANLHRDRPNNK